MSAAVTLEAPRDLVSAGICADLAVAASSFSHLLAMGLGAVGAGALLLALAPGSIYLAVSRRGRV
jgi:hypothetical protein